MFRSSVVKYDILSNNRRSKRHAVIECLFFKMPLLSGGLYFRRGVGGALLSGFYRRAKKLTLLSGWGMGHYVVCSRQPTQRLTAIFEIVLKHMKHCSRSNLNYR